MTVSTPSVTSPRNTPTDSQPIQSQDGLHPSVKIYQGGEIRNSTIEEGSFVGEHSRVRNSRVGRYVKIDRNTLLMNVYMGKYSYTGPFDMIFHAEIGSYTSISYGVTIGPPEHDYRRLSMHPFIHDNFYGILDKDDLLPNDKFDKPLSIGHDVWIGCNSTILRGVRIGNGAVVGANSLVKHDVPAYAIVVGNPARVIKYRFSENIIRLLEEMKWWEWDEEKIRRYSHLFTEELAEEKLMKLKLLK